MSPVEPGTAAVTQETSIWRRLASRLGIDMRPGEGWPAVLLFLTFFLFITFQYATKSVRQSSYVKGLGAANLPWVYLAVALCSYPLLRLYGRFADRVQRHHLMAATCTIIALSMVVFWWLFQFTWTWIPFALYVWISIAYVMNVSQFWSFSNHVLDPRQAKRLFGFVGAGGLLGGIAGGQVARLVSYLVDTRTTFLVAAAILMLAVGIIFLIQKRSPTDADAVAGAAGLAKLDKAKGGFEIIKNSRQLQVITAVMILSVVVAQIVDLQFNWAVESATTDLENATRFFGNFYSIMGIAAFLFQLAFTARIHRVLGVGVAMRILPITLAFGTAALFVSAGFFPSLLLATALFLKVGENGVRYSLEQATRELLFLPVPSKARVKAKAFIDVFVQRGAKGMAALLLLPVTFGLITAVQAGWITFVLIAIWLVVTVIAYKEYVRSFKAGLKKRSVDAEIPINVSDVTTLEMLVQALGSSDARQVIQSLDILASNQRENLVSPLLLYHDDAEVRQRTLEILATSGRADALPLIERRLADQNPEVRAEAIKALAELHGEDACELMLPKLRESDAGVRAAAVACLANYGTEQMVDQATRSLNDLLSDADPEIRAEGAKALGAIREPRFQELLIRLLYDREPQIAREAISAIRRRVARDGYNPIYVPTLVSLLNERRVKHEAREALVAFGEPAIPALAHFMGDPDEQLWVRRALPMAIAKIGPLAAAEKLFDHLGESRDNFQRRKLIDSIGALPDEIRHTVETKTVAEQIHFEAGRYLQALADLRALGGMEKAHLVGGRVLWREDRHEPDLLERLLGEHVEEHLRNIFGLVAVLFPPRDVWAAHRSLTGGAAGLRSHALEYLDNTLSGEVRKSVFAVIDDQPLDEKLGAAEKSFGVKSSTKVVALDRMLVEPEGGDSEECHLTLAALYAVHEGCIAELYNRVRSLVQDAADPFVGETARWVAAREGISV